MTTKKEKIIHAALELFAEEGYTATSTQKVAKAAGVSEGLIFRHFANKEGLLQAILAEGEDRLKVIFENILWETNPAKVLRKTLLMPFDVPDSEKNFWKLQFKLKWELNISGNEKLEPLHQALVKALTKLEYENPDLEAQLILQQVEGIATAILKDNLNNQEEFKNYLLNKYKF
jgi:AcrR family transcriptional regulator